MDNKFDELDAIYKLAKKNYLKEDLLKNLSDFLEAHINKIPKEDIQKTLDEIDDYLINVAIKESHIFNKEIYSTKDVKLLTKYPEVSFKPMDKEEIEKLIENLDLALNDPNTEKEFDFKTTTIEEFSNTKGFLLEPPIDYKIDDNNVSWLNNNQFEKLRSEMNEASRERGQKLRTIIGDLITEKPKLNIEDFSIFDNIIPDSKNFNEVSDYFKGSFILNQSKTNGYNVPNPILLLGNPGIGKTYFAKKLANLLNTSFYFLDANSITANWVLSGSSGQWQSADSGYIFKFMSESNTVSPLVIFDEIDKLSSGKNYDPFSTFHQLLEPENSKSFKDEFLNISFDASNIIYILTANSIKNIPNSLLSRMTIFDIKNPTQEESRKIAQSIYSNILGDSKLFNPILTEDSLSILENLVPRDIKNLINHSIYAQAANPNHKNDDSLKIISQFKNEKNIGF